MTQRSILRALEIWCVEMEAKGATTEVVQSGASQKGVLIIEEDCPTLKFTRDETKGQFAPYELEVI